MKIILMTVCAVFISCSGITQKFYTKTGKILFDATSSSSPEKIEAVNRAATCIIDTSTGVMQFAILMKSFEFERALMQEHFNENYIESHKFPKAEFKGKIKDNEDVNYTKDGTYKVKVKGDITIHGETKEVETDGKLVIQNGKINTEAEFTLKLSDFKISIPGLVADKVSKTAKITVTCLLEPFKN